MVTTLCIYSVVDIKEFSKLSSLSLLKGIMGIGESQQKILLPIYNSISCNLKFDKILENLDKSLLCLLFSFCAVVNLKLWTVRQ